MREMTYKGSTLTLDESTLHMNINTSHGNWTWDTTYQPKCIIQGQEILFNQARKITHDEWSTGIGIGIRSRYEGFLVNGVNRNLIFETIAWIEYATEDIYFEWIPIKEDELSIQAVYYPGYMAFDEPRKDWYTLLTLQQGLLIPNTWPTELGKTFFDGMLCTAANYMPWFGQVKEGAGYLAICEQPWDSYFYSEHPANGPYTHVGMKWGPSLGKMNYKRTIRYTFLSSCDYNDLCKIYRQYVKEKGLFTSLREKEAKVAQINQLIGSFFVHKGIKTQVQKDSRFFDPMAPDKNNHITSFNTRTEEIKHYKELGIKKLYLHLDGWAEPGYDNGHPDYLPACIEAGGWNAMKELVDTMHQSGYLFGIHDQYRDYYFAAKTFDQAFGCLQIDNTLPEHSNWAGGHQTYLCATQAPFYVKRNFKEIKENGISLDCAYLDVFTCNEGDECSHPWHKMSREQCFRYRGECFDYLLANGILPSSEEVSDWSMRSLVFAHYAPYHFMMYPANSPKKGIGVPLFNLVYHDCLILPWMMDKVSEHEDYMLYALLNGGAPYFIRMGAYENVDGSFASDFEFSEGEAIARCQVVSELHEKVAKCEMLRHEFLGENYEIQRTLFEDGTEVIVNLNDQTYQINTVSL